jgi:hypothetical protein
MCRVALEYAVGNVDARFAQRLPVVVVHIVILPGVGKDEVHEGHAQQGLEVS